MYKHHLGATAYEDVPECNTIAINVDSPHAWERVSTLIRNLLETGYDVATYLEGGVTYVIEFNPSSELDYGNEVLAWISPEEQKALVNGRYHEVESQPVVPPTPLMYPRALEPNTTCAPCAADEAVKNESEN